MERSRNPQAASKRSVSGEFEILPQPDDTTCGPTCLHAVYRSFGDSIPLEQVIAEIPGLDTGGTLGVQLAVHALRRRYSATIYTYNLHMFDPTWFRGQSVDLAGRLRDQARQKQDAKLRLATRTYLEFLELGGRVRFKELSARLITKHLKRRDPLLTGLSATYLYRCAREVGASKLAYDDVRGVPMGHFVILHGYDPERRRVSIADPLHDNPRFETQHYSVKIERVIGAILLGVLTYDANLLVLRPPGEEPA